MAYTEAQFENAVLETLRELGYSTVYSPDLDRPYDQPVLVDRLQEAILRLNPQAHPAARAEALRRVLQAEHPSLIENNATFHDQLTGGVEVTYFTSEAKHDLIRLVDYEHIDRNEFLVVNQFTLKEHSTKRPDVVIFVNGLPLVVLELKSCSREDADTSAAYRQLRNYIQNDIPSLFIYNAFCVLTDLVNAKAGTITAPEDRFMAWKSTGGERVESSAQFEALLHGMLAPGRLLEIVRWFIFYERDGHKVAKILAAYHQYDAVKKAVDRAVLAAGPDGDGKGGVLWHTQGSGKSFSMLFFARQVMQPLQNPTLIVLTDRNDLDEQLYGTFCRASDYLRQIPVQASSRAHLRQLLYERQSGGIIFTTIQKFEEDSDALSERRNILLIADEAHRSHYGLRARVDRESGRVSYGMAKYIRDALPNASFIGFTGTPIELLDRSTREVFGDYIDIYDMTQSVADEATLPIYYESRVINLQLDTGILERIDAVYDTLGDRADEYNLEKSKQSLAQMESVLGAQETVTTLCQDIVKHYEDRQHLLAGKAMLVAYNRPIALKIYQELLRLRPEWQDKLRVVMSQTNDDPEEWRELIGTKEARDRLATEFKRAGSPFKIAIVVDMWLTGFDVPALDTMYVYKPMQGHTLMQAIARVNRVYPGKVGGLVVDYVGIAGALKAAMKTYTKRDDENFGANDISTKALPKFMEKLEVLRDMFFALDYSAFIDGSDLDRARLIAEGMDLIVYDEEDKRVFLREAAALRQAESLCRSLLSQEIRIESAYFDAVRVGVLKIDSPEKLSLAEINSRVAALLQESIKSEGVINIFADETSKFSLFDQEYLDAIGRMRQENLAVELLRRLLQDQVRAHLRVNLVQSELFSERMQRVMQAYRNQQLTNAEVIAELLRIAKELQEAEAAGNALGLVREEKAFYDALTKPEAVRDFYSNEELKAMTQELVDMMRKNATIDWNKRESARARMRSLVKRLLRKYKYPPESAPEALEIVLRQAEKWSEETLD